MKILMYRYGSICEPDIITSFSQLGITVIEENTELTNKKISDADRVHNIENMLKDHHFLFVFSINFYPAIARICEIYNILYLCWTVDSPVPELFSTAVTCKTNRIFLFDYAQYSFFSPYNINGIFYLPLASCVERFDKVTSSITSKDTELYSTDISFVGSLYTEKNPLNELHNLSDYVKGYIQALVDASLNIYGYNPIPDAVNQQIINEIKANDSNFYQLNQTVAPSDSYIAAHSYVGMKAAETERIRTLNALAEHFDVDLFTRSNTKPLHKVHIHGGVETLTEMPKIFHLSKINLNMTIKPIQTGLPLRIFDIMGCGGFLMTNYQPELTDYFEIGTDLEAYSSMEELIDKCAYYLSHEEERKQIALNGYQKIRKEHCYIHRIKSMLEVIS